MRDFTNGLGIAQAFLGMFGFYGVFLYLAEPTSNNSRYQLLFLPFWGFLFALPLLIVSALLYRKCHAEMSPPERWAFNIGCLLPIAGFASAVSFSLLGW